MPESLSCRQNKQTAMEEEKRLGRMATKSFHGTQNERVTRSHHLISQYYHQLLVALSLGKTNEN